MTRNKMLSIGSWESTLSLRWLNSRRLQCSERDRREARSEYAKLERVWVLSRGLGFASAEVGAQAGNRLCDFLGLDVGSGVKIGLDAVMGVINATAGDWLPFLEGPARSAADGILRNRLYATQKRDHDLLLSCLQVLECRPNPAVVIEGKAVDHE